MQAFGIQKTKINYTTYCSTLQWIIELPNL
jgi:hypothetical protein